jgi:hypothetical protein
MKLETEKWIEAAKILRSNASAKVECPECKKGVLIVKDESISGWNKIDRYMICSNCGKWNVLTFLKSSIDDESSDMS